MSDTSPFLSNFSSTTHKKIVKTSDLKTLISDQTKNSINVKLSEYETVNILGYKMQLGNDFQAIHEYFRQALDNMKFSPFFKGSLKKQWYSLDSKTWEH